MPRLRLQRVLFRIPYFWFRSTKKYPFRPAPPRLVRCCTLSARSSLLWALLEALLSWGVKCSISLFMAGFLSAGLQRAETAKTLSHFRSYPTSLSDTLRLNTMSMHREYARCQHLLPGCRPYHNERLQARITRETKLHSLFNQEGMAMFREAIQKTKVAARGWLL